MLQRERLARLRFRVLNDLGGFTQEGFTISPYMDRERLQKGSDASGNLGAGAAAKLADEEPSIHVPHLAIRNINGQGNVGQLALCRIMQGTRGPQPKRHGREMAR